MSTTLIHLMKLATLNDVVITFRPTKDPHLGIIRMWDIVEIDPALSKKVEMKFDYRATTEDTAMRDFLLALQTLVNSCGRQLLTPTYLTGPSGETVQ